jgi:hypothetical protein
MKVPVVSNLCISLPKLVLCHRPVRFHYVGEFCQKINFNLKKKNSPFVIDKFFPFLFVTRRQNVIDFIL